MGKRLMLNKYAPKKVIKKTEQELIFDVEIPFGAEDSELEEVSYRIPNGFHAEIEDNRVVIKKDEQKPAWSEEDETTRNALINLVEMYYGGCFNQSEKNRLLDWLKSLSPQDHCVDDKQQTGITAWIARDKSGEVLLYEEEPVKLKNDPIWESPDGGSLGIKELPEGIDPRWEDEEPIEVELIIKKKTND